MGDPKLNSKKRKQEANSSSTGKIKRPKTSKAEEKAPAASVSKQDDSDFPRGGGSSFTAAEYKAIRSEALKEIKDGDIFKQSNVSTKQTKSKQGKENHGRRVEKESKGKKDEKRSELRVEQLNHKRVAIGMKVLCRIAEIRPYSLIVSLPGQILGHIPITHISSQLTNALETLDEDEEVDEDEDQPRIPELSDLFTTGQLLRAVVSDVKALGTTDGRMSTHLKDGVEKASRRIELSLIPDQVNAGVSKDDLKKGYAMSGVIKSVEDHGYVVDIGFPALSGFLHRKPEECLHTVGKFVDVTVVKMADDGRTCIFTDDAQSIRTSVIKDISSSASLIPGLLVTGLITGTSSSGLLLQVLGSFDGTVDLYHLPTHKNPDDFKIGQKVKARILYDVTGSSPPQYSLSLKEQVVEYQFSKGESAMNEDRYPVGMTLSSVKVKRVESERGVVVEVDDGVCGYVHISNIADEHIPSLSPSSGQWKIGTIHQARVLGYHPLDGLLQLSAKPSVLSQAFLRVNEVVVGEVVKGVVKKLTDSGLFVSLNGSVDGVIWPNHYADIILKHPQKRFKPGTSLKCRILSVDVGRKRIELTAKKTLVESELPIVSDIKSVETGTITHGTVCKVSDKGLMVEFYNHVKAFIPQREASESPITHLQDSFFIGKPLKVCILSVDRESSKIVASIRLSSEDIVGNIKNIQVGQSVSGIISEVHNDNAVLILQPQKARGIISLRNLANARKISIEELKNSLKKGDTLEDLVVVSRNVDKGIAIVASQPSRPLTVKQPQVDLDSLSIGSQVEGRVTKHLGMCARVKFSGGLAGTLHLVDTNDDFQRAVLPEPGTLIKACVVSLDRERRRVTLSTRASRMRNDTSSRIPDAEIRSLDDVHLGQEARGFVKSIAEHGVFITLGRNVDARIQIKELYDDFVKDWKSGFKPHQVVSGKILGIDKGKKQIEFTLRTGLGPATENTDLTYNDLHEGQIIEGRIKKIEDFGVFVKIDGSKLSGLCHKSELADNEDADVSMALRNFREGDRVKAIVLNVDKEKRRISLGLKPSYFASDEEGPPESGDVVDEVSEGEAQPDDSKEDEDIEMLKASGDEDSAGSDEDSNDSGLDVAHADYGIFQPAPSSKESHGGRMLPTLQLGDFDWGGEDEAGSSGQSDLSSSDANSDSEAEKPPRKSRKRKIEEDFTADMQTRKPESVADFERHLLASPNSSYLWLQYMSFQLQLSEIDKAREVGKRALQAISIREEQEKLNVWIGLLNLENTYGTVESLDALFKDAARHNDSKTVHLRMAEIFDQSEKLEKAEDQYKKTSKKFGYSSKVWTLFGEFYMRHGRTEDARKLLPRSLQSLEKRKHLKTISKFAQLEYKLGEPERGKTIFEGIVDSHTKRWDIWSVYIDMEASQKDVASIRNLFERLFSHKMTSHKAKSFFKKWLELERRIGDDKGQQLVKEKALEWTQRTSTL